MLYIIGLICPPVAVLACGKPWQALFVTLPLTLLFWIPGVLHAWATVSADRKPLVGSVPAHESEFFTSLCFFLAGIGFALFWVARSVISTPKFAMSLISA